MNSILWNSEKQSKNFFATDNDSEKRTQNLAMLMGGLHTNALNLKTPIKKCGTAIDARDTTLSSNEKSDYKNYLNSAALTLQGNPRMLEYKFDENEELETILVHSHVDLLKQLSTDDKEICEKACEVYVAVQLFIDSTYKDAQTKPKVTLTGKLSNKCDFDNTEPTNLVSGGSKSRRRHRRKPARKTRRGRIRKPKAKAKSKTHRHRRRSRVRKHKKYTSRRR